MSEMRSQESSGAAAPRLEVHWERRGQNFLDSLRAVFAGPRPDNPWPSPPTFRAAWVRPHFPGRSMLASVLWHILLINISIPLGHLAGNWVKPERKLLPPRIEITWYGPAQDLSPLVAPAPSPRRSPPGMPTKPLPPRGAQALHPDATILSLPPVPSSPRQTLIQPTASVEPPKILPAMPNVIAWNKTPERARLPVSPTALAQLHPRAPRRQLSQAPAPEPPNLEKQLGPLDIAASAIANQQPSLPLAAMNAASAPQAHEMTPALPAAPEIAPSGATVQVIALSVTPGNLPPPPTNAQATLIASPEGSRLGVPGGALADAPNTHGGEGNSTVAPGGTGEMASTGAPGPANLLIGRASDARGTGGGGGGVAVSTPPGFALPLPPKPAPRANLNGEALAARRAPSRPEITELRPSSIARQILGPGPIRSMLINMPNLTSATGSWVIDFSELGDEGPAPDQLVGPDPTRKVDPKYPPEFVSQHVEGEVVLYAIIRSDGSVGPIRVVKGLDPTLDQNAADAFARWVFHPALRNGKPVELEAVVHIPFRAAPPL